MAKPTIERYKDNGSTRVWQGIHNPGHSILVQKKEHSVLLTQDRDVVAVDYDTIDDLCKLLKSLKK